MKSVYFQADQSHEVVETEARLLDVLLAHKVNVKMLCGGRGVCATCHVRIVKNPDSLTPVSSAERLRLAVLTGAGPDSRLACQCRVIGDGVEVALPEGLFIESSRDLESLIGQRAGSNILHPLTGQILIEQGKLIARSLIMKLQDVDVDIERIKSENPLH